MDDNRKMISVFSGSVVVVHKLKHELEAAGIKVIVRNHDAMAYTVGYVNMTRDTMELSILETEIENARPIIARIKERFKL